MASKYWLKLYHEMLDDPKMARLTDRLFRRMINLFLLAGDVNKGGYLPPLFDIAYRLRASDDEVLTDLQELATFGIVEEREGSWVITKFAERQGPRPPAERARVARDRRRREQYEGVTQRDRNVTRPSRSVMEAVTKRDENVTECVRNVDRSDIDRDPDPEEKARPPPGEADLWAQLLDELKLMMTKVTYDTHLGGCRLTEVIDDNWRVEVPNKYGAAWLNFRWKKRIDELASGIASRPITVQFWAVEGVKF